MKTVVIGTDNFLNKDVKKIKYENDELPLMQLFNSSDVIIGNPSSPVAICLVYTWKSDYAPKSIREFAQRISNYAAITGYWRTTNGGRYAFSNILANPNINKILILVFNAKDNGHLLSETLVSLWKYGTDNKGLVRGSRSPNPRFEQVPAEGLERVRKQADLLILRNLEDSDHGKIEDVVKALIQEPENARKVSDFKGLEFYSNIIKNDKLYDGGARFEEPYLIDLSSTAEKVTFKDKSYVASVGHSIQAKNLTDASEQVASYIFSNGSMFQDERGIINVESRSFTLTVLDPLEEIPRYFDKIYVKRYVGEFMEGKGECLDEFSYTYHERIFKRWGNQVEKAINILKDNLNTRRCLISLWDPAEDLGNSSAPCLDFIWLVIRNDVLELHATYRSHHLATVTGAGKLMKGEGAMVPNLYALATLQEDVCKKVGVKRGPLILNDFSGHLYVSGV